MSGCRSTGWQLVPFDVPWYTGTPFGESQRYTCAKTDGEHAAKPVPATTHAANAMTAPSNPAEKKLMRS